MNQLIYKGKLRNSEAARVFWFRHDQRQKKIVRHYFVKILAVLKAQVNDFINAIDSKGYNYAVGKLGEIVNADSISKVIKSLYHRSAYIEANYVLNYLKPQKSEKRRPASIGLGFEELGDVVDQYFQIYLLNNSALPITEFTKRQIQEYLIDKVDRGMSVEQAVQEFRDTAVTWTGRGGKSFNRALRIAKTESTRAMSFGGLIGAYMTGVDVEKVWVTSEDERVRGAARPAKFPHTALDLNIQSLMGAFFNGEKIKFPGDPEASIENTANCFPADTNIEGQFLGGQRLKYSGKLFEIVTSSGKRLSVTPNHPVFTNKGTVPAKLLTKGQYVISNIKKAKSVSALVNDYIEKEPVKAGDYFSSLNVFSSKKVMSGGLNFNGDGKFGYGNIDIVNINRELEFDRMSAMQDLGKFSLKASKMSRFNMLLYCVSQQLFSTEFNTFDGNVSGGNLNQPFFCGHTRPFKYFSVGTSTNWNASRFEVPIEYGTSDATFIRKLFEGNTGCVAFDEIVNIRDYDFSGHVYDFSTLSGAILANNIYISNCRCSMYFREKARPKPRRVRSLINFISDFFVGFALGL